MRQTETELKNFIAGHFSFIMRGRVQYIKHLVNSPVILVHLYFEWSYVYFIIFYFFLGFP